MNSLFYSCFIIADNRSGCAVVEMTDFSMDTHVHLHDVVMNIRPIKCSTVDASNTSILRDESVDMMVGFKISSLSTSD